MKKLRALIAVTAVAVVALVWHWMPNALPVWVPSSMGDYSIRLSNGYAIVRSSPGCISLVRPSSSEMISPPIDGYRVHGSLVIGHTRHWDAPGRPGYFIVDTKTGKRWHRMTKDQWTEVLKNQGITSVPVLVEPRPFSGWRARF